MPVDELPHPSKRQCSSCDHQGADVLRFADMENGGGSWHCRTCQIKLRRSGVTLEPFVIDLNPKHGQGLRGSDYSDALKEIDNLQRQNQDLVDNLELVRSRRREERRAYDAHVVKLMQTVRTQHQEREDIMETLDALRTIVTKLHDRLHPKTEEQLCEPPSISTSSSSSEVVRE